MTAREKEVLGEALRLTLKQRARIAAELLASLADTPQHPAESTSGLEIERRAKRALAGKSVGIDWEIVRERILKSSRRR